MKIFSEPELQVINITVSDVIATSPEDPTQGAGGPNELPR